ncbi:hypothetical protein GCM10010964_32940 [Caldovatus sediminis]|uniref:GSCFA domain-containing protein n=1 Tax=Caldovatus sediminis TaxID=2041189 RepID=A0A8J2ZDP9_9PROT|nr:GSCFA domain-containing protein [Caldovatus sediminis]GGG42875.1 hypothetical protein GCM10010964_32940 [Caldovatus sediminis]
MQAAAHQSVKQDPPDERLAVKGGSFYRGENANFGPERRHIADPIYLERFLLHGWMPSEPLIDKDTCITAFGSCFAANVTKHLSSLGYNTSRDRAPDVYISRIGEGLVNVYALLGQLEWALENIAPHGELWHGYDAETMEVSEEIRIKTRDLFLRTDFFIITLGLSEVWYDEPTGGVFWRAIPKHKFDPARHRFRVCSMAETKAALQRMWDLIRKHVPQARLLFTLSPIPLRATFRPIGCITASSASKAILRAAVDEFMRDNQADVNDRLFYFPSFEIVTELFYNRFGLDDRHPPAYVLNVVMRTFEAVYCKTGLTLADVHQILLQSRLQSARAGVRMERSVSPIQEVGVRPAEAG